MLYVYLNKQGNIAYMDSHPFKLEDSTATIIEVNQDYPEPIKGKSIYYEWDAENKQVNFTYIDMPEEPKVEEEYSPTLEEIQMQLLLNSEYNSILLETLLEQGAM